MFRGTNKPVAKTSEVKKVAKVYTINQPINYQSALRYQLLAGQQNKVLV